MKKIGIIGGMGPESTVDYYEGIISRFKGKEPSFNYPEIILYSINMSKLMPMLICKDLDGLKYAFLEYLTALKMAGAEFAVLSANTPHIIFDQLKELSPIPLISIVEATCKRTIKLGLKRPVLLGTKTTMDAPFYPDVFGRSGITVITPTEEDKQKIHEKIFRELELGVFKDETRKYFIKVIENLVHTSKIDSIILGCTELPLLLAEESYCGIPVLNTTKIHVDEIVREACN